MNIRTNKIWIVLAVAAVIGIGTFAYADWGSGYGYQGRMYGHQGYGYHHGMGAYKGCPYSNDLSDEQIAALEKESEAFWTATKDLRKNIYDKELALRDELAKEKPDAKKASALQKEISELEGTFDQKRVEHIIRMKEIAPDAGGGRSYSMRGRGGYGRYHGGGYCRQ